MLKMFKFFCSCALGGKIANLLGYFYHFFMCAQQFETNIKIYIIYSISCPLLSYFHPRSDEFILVRGLGAYPPPLAPHPITTYQHS